MAHHDDQTWESLAKRDPYWAVVTEDRYRGENLDGDAKREFFATGERHVGFLFKVIRRQFDVGFRPSSALDFGCGVGRLLPGFSAECDHVVGADVSTTMLDEAKRSLSERGIANVELRATNGESLPFDERFDLVHTFIVLQHVQPRRGMRIIDRLFHLIEPGGIGAIHVSYHPAKGSRFVDRLLRLTKRALGSLGPRMQMYPYDLSAVFEMLQSLGVKNIHVELTNHGYLGALLIFRAPKL